MNKFDLDTILLEFSSRNGSSSFTIRDAVEGVQIFGGIGSGKTSGSGRIIALKYLSYGFGGLILCAKADEKEMWQDYCRLTDRLGDLVVIEPGGKHFFNLLEYESKTNRLGISITENIVQVLKTVIKASEEKGGGRDSDSFWETALDMLLFSIIDLSILAYGKISVDEMFDIVQTAPSKEIVQDTNKDDDPEKRPFNIAFEQARKKIFKRIDYWKQQQTAERRKSFADAQVFEKAILDEIPDARLMKYVDQFFAETYRNLSDRTRSIIQFSFSGFLFRLLKEPVYSMFCSQPSTITPDDCLNGKIILLNLPVKQYHKVGQDTQIMFKYIWQRAMEKRDVKQIDRPVFLWADEAQNFLHPHDSEYQATARSSRIATVYISQNLPNYNATMGGLRHEHRVKSFLGTLATKIFHANADSETNNYASDLIGEEFVENLSKGNSFGKDFSRSNNTSITLEKIIRPEEFVRLKTGGPMNNYSVEGIIHRQGYMGNGRNHSKVRFNQNYKP